jgi:hypothetical protein
MIGLIAGGLGLAGGIAGMLGGQQSQSTTRQLAPESELEKQAGQLTGSQLTELQRLIGAGPGQADVQAGTDASRQLAALLQQFSQGGYMPGANDFAQANALTQQVFAPQQQQLNQQFADQRVQANQAMAKMGRGPADPTMMNALARTQGQQQAALGAQMTSYSAQQAMAMPQQRLQYANQLAQVNAGLASQALANRQALFSMGSQLRGQEQNFRAGTASSTTTQQQPGGFGGFLSGALAGVGAGIGAASMFGGRPASGNSIDYSKINQA